MNISVVVPVFNEEAMILKNIGSMLRFCRDNFRQSEVIIVNDGSVDRTGKIIEDLTREHNEVVIITNSTKRGKGYSLRLGLCRARGEYVCFTDADLSAPIQQVKELICWIEKGFDIVIGSRGLPDSKIEVRQSWCRENAGKTFNVLLRTMTALKFKDTQCGFKVLRQETLKEIVPMTTLDGFCFDAELLYIASKLNYKIREVPITWRNSSDSRVNLFLDPLRMLLELLQIKYNDWTGKYDK